MNESYLKYGRDKWTTILIKKETKAKLNDMRYELKAKSYNDLINKLIESYGNNKEM